jgi:hypothetical protein
MTNSEFSDSFDTLLNSYASQAMFGEEAAKTEIVLDEYEKSVLLTQAQDNIIKAYFQKHTNELGQGFDDSTRRQVDFSSLIKTAELSPVSGSGQPFDHRGIIFKLPTVNTGAGGDGEDYSRVLYILNEALIKSSASDKRNDNRCVVVPINYKEYDREMTKAYAQPLKKQVWRLFQNNTTQFDIYSEVIPIWDTDVSNIKYRVRYVERPTPIILVDLPNGLIIDGYTEEMSCTLNPILHPDILNEAVRLAISSRASAVARAEAYNREQERRQ